MVPVEEWADRLKEALGRGFYRVVVVRETTSTQDAARRLKADPGHVIVAARQTGGRGRLGRSWADTQSEGVAATFVTRPAPAERLALVCAVGTARAAETFLDHRVGIKWPNDIVVEGRKLAGILVEITDGKALIGIGVNVSQTAWPEALAEKAVSLAQLGAGVDRIDVLVALLRSMNETLGLDDRTLCAQFAQRDVLEGTRVTFQSGAETITGTVVRIDPMRGLLVQTAAGGDVYLQAATTTILSAP